MLYFQLFLIELQQFLFKLSLCFSFIFALDFILIYLLFNLFKCILICLVAIHIVKEIVASNLRCKINWWIYLRSARLLLVYLDCWCIKLDSFCDILSWSDRFSLSNWQLHLLDNMFHLRRSWPSTS